MSLKKVIVVGDGGVGKTALIDRFFEEDFRPRYVPTIGVEVRQYENDLQFWDFAGREKFSGIQSFDGANMVIIVFSVDSQISYTNIEYWRKRVTDQCAYADIPVIVCANKCDIKERKFEFTADIVVSSKENVRCDGLLDLIRSWA